MKCALGHNLLQLRVLRLGFFQDGDVGVGVFPEGEEIFVGGERPDAGGIGIRSLRGSQLQGVGASHSQMRQRPPSSSRQCRCGREFSGTRRQTPPRPARSTPSPLTPLTTHAEPHFKSLHSGHNPDVASLWSETVEQNPIPIRRPYWVVNSHIRVGKLVDLFRLPRIDWRDPQNPVAHNVHDPGMIGRKGNVRAFP